MALTYDIKNDIRYKEGKLEGKEEILFLSTKNMLLNDFSYEQIITVFNVPAEVVQKVAKSMKNNFIS
ncbi:MAG: hypothetical protein COZ18_10160 [Flexibacter sp. CG_4_10_14_3_um_filter_32_15]|nr:MAG: hypothetical protein COZ18_10160 [Flexibacter sp. CG_4_10_14_3_um_filter_32_15]